MRRFCIVFGLALLLGACGAPAAIPPNDVATATTVPTATATSTPLPTYNSTPAPTATATPQPPLEDVFEVIEWNDDFAAGGSEIHVAGVVRNISSATVCDVVVCIRQYGKYDALMAWDSTPVEDDCLAPGEESAFQLVMPRHVATERVAICRIEWR